MTGEHKIKASAIRSEFGAEKMVIGRFGETVEDVRNVQGPKSKNLHFGAKICRACNSVRTQASDREFDIFNGLARKRLESGDDPARVFQLERYQKESEPYLNVFRYFAKLLCCHGADIDGPIPTRLSRFSLSEGTHNCVWLAVDRDVTYSDIVKTLGEHQYAAHGGLIVKGSKQTGDATAFHSTLTIGPLRYVFCCNLSWFERLELRLAHKEFQDWVKAQMAAALANPISEKDKRRLGL